MRKYNDRTVYDCLNNNILVDCGIKYLNLPPMPIGDSSIPNKRACYTPDPLPYAIYVTSGNYVITFTTPYESSKVIFLNYDTPNNYHTMMKYKPIFSTDKRGYYSRYHDVIICHKIQVRLLSILYS